MTTTETSSNDLCHSITVIKGNEKTVIKIRLNDECRNGHEDFSLTCDIYEQLKNGRWEDVGGGCAHEHILKLRPELAPFAALHLSDCNGLPMHCAANALYWLQGIEPQKHTAEYHGGTGSGAKSPEECRRVFAEHIRATPEQVTEILIRSPRTETELRAVLEDMGFIQQWQAEAKAAIATLEQWAGKKFVSANSGSRWKQTTPEERALIEERRRSGYYDPAQVAARDAAAAAKVKAERLAEIEKDLTARIEKLQRQAQVSRYMVGKYYPQFQNFIYYDHSNELSFNWSTTEKLITKAEAERIEAELDRSALPEGIKLKWQERPKY